MSYHVNIEKKTVTMQAVIDKMYMQRWTVLTSTT